MVVLGDGRKVCVKGEDLVYELFLLCHDLSGTLVDNRKHFELDQLRHLGNTKTLAESMHETDSCVLDTLLIVRENIDIGFKQLLLIVQILVVQVF